MNIEQFIKSNDKLNVFNLPTPTLESFLKIHSYFERDINIIAKIRGDIHYLFKKGAEFSLADAFCQKNYQNGLILNQGANFEGLKDPDFYLTVENKDGIKGTLGIRRSRIPPELRNSNNKNKDAFELMRFSFDVSSNRKDQVGFTQNLFKQAINFLCLQTKSGDPKDLFLWMMTYEKMTRFFTSANRMKDLFINTKKSPEVDCLPSKCRCFFEKKETGLFLINTKSGELRKMFLESRARLDNLLVDKWSRN